METLETKLAGSTAKLLLVEDIVCTAALCLMAFLPASEAFLRLLNNVLGGVFNQGHSLFGVPSSLNLIKHLLLVASLVAGMICTRKESHLSISLVQYIPEGTIKHRLKIFTYLLSAFVATMLAFSSISFIKIGLDSRTIAFIPVRVFASMIPLGYGIIAFRFARLTRLKGCKIVFPVFAVVLGTIASFPALAKIIWGFDMPDNIMEICYIFSDIAGFFKVPFVVFLLLAALGGTPLFVVIGGMCLLLLLAGGMEIDSVVADIYTSLTNDSIIAIPLFTVAGFFLSESRAGERLVNTFRCFFSWLPGGIIIVSVLICAFFTSFTGASGVTILALGGILYMILSEHLNYPQKFSIGLLTSVGSIGLLFPPSLPLIMVGTVSQVRIDYLFLGGIVPGLLLVFAMIVFGVIISLKVKIPVEKFEAKKSLSALKGAAFEILLPFFLVAGYFSGILNLVELGAVAVIYVFLVEVFINRDIKLSEVKLVFQKAIPIIGGIFMILALSKALSDYIIQTQAPSNIAAWMQETLSSKIVFLLLLNLALLVVGCLMDVFSAIMVVLPLIIPLAQVYGIDPVHLGIIFLVNLELGYITPPVGLNLFLASYRFKKPFVEICRYVAPFLLVRFVVVLLVTYLPWISTWLVSVVSAAG